MRSLFVVVVVSLFGCSPPVVMPTDAGTPDTAPREGRDCAPRGGIACESQSKVLVCEFAGGVVTPDQFVGYECSRCTSDGGYTECSFAAVPTGARCPAFAEGVAHCGTAFEMIQCSGGEFRSVQCDGGCVAATFDAGAGVLCRP